MRPNWAAWTASNSWPRRCTRRVHRLGHEFDAVHAAQFGRIALPYDVGVATNVRRFAGRKTETARNVLRGCSVRHADRSPGVAVRPRSRACESEPGRQI